MPPIYLDNNATTPVDPAVVDAMSPFWNERFGNPSSTHRYGWEAESAVDKARRQVGKLIGAKKDTIIFTAGATESNNTVLSAIARSTLLKGDHIVTSAIEHKCVLHACKALQAQGTQVTYVDVGCDGLVSPDDVSAAITPRTRLVSIMAANNEIGTLQPIAKIGRIAKLAGIAFHTDAAQLLGKLPIDVESHNIDFLSASAHKIYGPMGVGAIYARDPRQLAAFPLIHGGGQESGVRSGTLNVPGIVGFGEACEIARKTLNSEAAALGRMREELIAFFLNKVEGSRINGHPTQCLPGCVNFCVPGIDVMDLLGSTREKLALSTGSACASGEAEPSHVLSALGLSQTEMAGSFRVGLGRFTTPAEVKAAGQILVESIASLPRKKIGRAA